MECNNYYPEGSKFMKIVYPPSVHISVMLL